MFLFDKEMVVFDVDGTLLDNQTDVLMGGLKDILVMFGKEEEVFWINEEYQRRKKFGPWGLTELAELYKGLPEKELKKIAAIYCEKNLAQGAKEVIGELLASGRIVGSLSSSPQFLIDVLSGILSLDFAEGNKLEFREGIATGEFIDVIVDRHIKAEILKKKMQEYRLRKGEVVVIGDSIADLPMAKEAGCFIAFRPQDDGVKEAARKVIDNLLDLLEIFSQ